MKPYAVREKLRTSVQGTLSYTAEGTWTTGIVWDLSETGWRTTGERPMPIGLETIVFLTLRDGEELHYILIESAMVRWSDGRHAGWEILRIDALSQTCLADVMDQCSQDGVTSGMKREDRLLHVPTRPTLDEV
jgi:hypothetical protein